MFSVEDREQLRDALVSAARSDPRITGAAITGSGARDAEDRWSDIDLALCLDVGADEAAVIADWTARMYQSHRAVDHLDVWRGTTRFRVFLLADTLQVDIAFWSSSEFGATGPAFRLLFGAANPRPASGPPSAAELVGMGWLYALHVRSSIARGRLWQAEYMVSLLRDQVLALACLRYGVPAVQGRGLDDLPAEVTGPLASALVRSLDIDELSRVLRIAADALLREAGHVDAELAGRIADPVRELTASPRMPSAHAD